MAVSRRGVIRVLGGGVVIAAVAGAGLSQCDPMPDAAVAGWKGPAPDVRDPRVRALSYALLAPNPHNMQAWMADLREPDAITFYCDRARLLPETDPYSRQVVIGCGCFLETLRIAAAEQGHRVEQRFFPQGGWPENAVGETPLVRLALVKDANAMRDPLFAQILLRRSGKVNYREGAAASAAHIGAIASALGTTSVAFASTAAASEVARLKTIAAAAYKIESATHRTHMETVDRLRIGADDIARHRDGIAINGPAIWLMKTLGLLTPATLADPTSLAFKQTIDLYTGWINNTWSFGWFSTATNDRVAQVEAGAAYVRANLKAAEIGLSIAPLSQALQEFPEMAREMQAILAATGTPAGHTLQMFFRMGYAAPPPPAPRRPVDDIIRA